MTTTDKEKDKGKDDTQWIRQRDTGGIRAVPASEWKKSEKDLRAEGYAPCNEDGTPLEDYGGRS